MCEVVGSWVSALSSWCSFFSTLFLKWMRNSVSQNYPWLLLYFRIFSNIWCFESNNCWALEILVCPSWLCQQFCGKPGVKHSIKQLEFGLMITSCFNVYPTCHLSFIPYLLIQTCSSPFYLSYSPSKAPFHLTLLYSFFTKYWSLAFRLSTSHSFNHYSTFS